jgi:phenylalanine-4-hydroxylase
MNANHATWNVLSTYTLSRLKGLACQSFWHGMDKLAYNPDQIPDLEIIRDQVFKETGWTLQRAKGEVPAGEFLEMLANKSFPLVYELRPANETFASSDPDLWHELIGHVPMLFDPFVRELYWTIGQAARNISEDKLAALIRLYWYFAEYGLIKENGEAKIFGAGLLASPLGAYSVKNKRVTIKKMTTDGIVLAQHNPYSFQKNLFVFDSLDQVENIIGEIIKPSSLVHTLSPHLIQG